MNYPDLEVQTFFAGEDSTALDVNGCFRRLVSLV